MPLDYYCEGCGLVFSVGIYATRSRYPARVLLVCKSCGTVHELQRPLREKQANRLMTQPCPLLMDNKPDHPVFTRRLTWNECSLSPSFADGCSLRGEEAWTRFLEEAVCSYCYRPGMLTDQWERDEQKCPACHEEKLRTTDEWIT